MRYRYLMVESRASDDWPPLFREMARTKKIGSLMTRISVEDSSRNVATAKIMATRCPSVLMCGAEVLAIFRPDLKLSQVQGVPMVINWQTGKKPVVAIPTIHPHIAGRTKKLAQSFEEDFAQFVWRGTMDPLGRWPETCVLCGREVDHYDVMGVAWCGGCFRGAEPPSHSDQLALEV